MDRLTPAKRSWNMSRIKGKNTKPEVVVRSVLHSMGYRFRIHVKQLFGTPDIVLKKHGTIIMVHGCFWHRHKGCKFAYTPNPKSRRKKQFWRDKFAKNVLRDSMVSDTLQRSGWRVITIWECEASDESALRSQLRKALRKNH